MGKTTRHLRVEEDEIYLDTHIGSFRVAEAPANFLVYLQDTHVDTSTQLDATNCAFAQACKDTYHSPFAMFWRSWAYIVLPNDKGEDVALRFAVPERTVEQIIEFDKTGKAEQGGYWLHAPTPGQTLRKRRERDRQYRKDCREGRRKPQTKRKRGPVKLPKEMTQVRSGTGKVRFAQIGGQ